MKGRFLHSETIHNLTAPMEIVPEIINLLNPKSVVDVGCGLGTFLYCFKQMGIKDVLGIDGAWVDKKLLSKYLAPGEFLGKDLEKEISLKRKYDLVISLEVAEHLSANSADTFVRNLVSAGKFILFSAAIPFQGGQNHINEQLVTYWENKFLKYDYIIHDVIRPIFWNNPNIFWWYKQNMVLITPREFHFDSNLIYNPLRNVVHFQLYISKARGLDDFYNGRLSSFTYIKCLAKSIFRNGNLNKLRFILKTKKHR